jgi:predicted metal-dependent enzyme (double-stranded beta helix superfamily)
MTLTTFDVDSFIEECRACLTETDTRLAIRETLSRALADPAPVAATLPPESAGIQFLYRADDLTVIEVVWAPGMRLHAHNHNMWACIGIYGGREDNHFFRRGEGGRGVVESGGKRLETGDVTLLGTETIHAVENPSAVPTGAIHIYGGDFVAQPRSQWVPPALEEESYDADLVARTFAEANERWHGSV